MKQGRTRKWIAVLLVLILAAGCVPAAQAAKKTKDIEAFSLGERGFGPWYYLPSTVPDGLARKLDVKAVEIYETVTQGNAESREEYADSITVDFVSGDEALKDAIVIEETTGSKRVNDEWVPFAVPGYRIDLDNIKEPGRAVFHFTCESEHFLLERDVTLRVLSWDEYPLADLKDSGENVIAVNKNGTIEDTQINARFMTLHADEIAKQIAEGDEKIQVFAPYSGGYLTDKKTGEYVEMGWYAVGAYNNEESGKAVDRLTAPYAGDYGYRFKDYGVYEAHMDYELGNIELGGTVTIAVLPYRISFPGSVAPGETAQISIADDQPEAGRTFTWELKGEGVTLDAEAGTLTADENAELGSTFTITATPSDGGYAVTAEGKVAVGLLGGKKIDSIEMYEGFSVPVMSTESGEYGSRQSHDNRYISGSASDSAPYMIYLASTVYDEDEFMEKPEDAIRVYNSINLEGITVAESQEFEENGVPCKAWIGTVDSNGELIGILRMGRNNRLAEIVLYSYAGTGDPAGVPKITMNDMETLAELIGYDPSKASITVEDGAITVAPKKEGATLIGGKKMAFAATFANKDKVNKKAKNDKITWSVVEKGTDAAPEFITIDKAGNLSAGAKLAEVKEVEVRASSDIFHTMGTYAVTVIPATKKITFDPAELNFYVGTDDPQTARAIMEPATVPPTGLTWTPSKKNAVEIVPGEDGTAVITPLAAGKITVTVKEPGGKSGVLKINILQPVTGLTLTQKGKTKPGSAVTITAGLEPKTAGNKTLEWSVNVDESVATISQKGQLKIAKTAESGTVITVTCKALGAPEAITATIDVTVE